MTRWSYPMEPLHSGRKIIGYARVSTAEQKLDHQLDLLAKVQCDKVFYDHGVSGAKAERPGLSAALKALVPGDVLVVYKLDRLGRSVQHLSDLITRLDNDDIHFCSLTEGIDTTTSGGRLVFHVFAAVAEFHRDLIRENTINGLNAARGRGSRLGRPPLLDARTIVKARNCILEDGKSFREVAKQLNVSLSTIRRCVKSTDGAK